MNYFDSVANQDLHPGFIKYLDQFQSFVKEHFNVPSSFIDSTLLDLLQGAKFDNDDLVPFLVDHPETDNRTLHALLRYEAEHHNVRKYCLNIDFLFEAEERDWLFSDKENIGDGLAGGGIAEVCLGFNSITNPEVNADVSLLYYSDLWREEWMPGDDESLIESIPEYLAFRTRLNLLVPDADCEYANHNNIDIPKILEAVSDKNFHALPFSEKADRLKLLMNEFDLNGHADVIKLSRKWVVEYGRCLLLKGEEVGKAMEEVVGLCQVLMELGEFREELRDRTVDLMLRTMLIPFPDYFVSVFGKLETIDSLILNDADYKAGFDYLSPHFNKSSALFSNFYGLFSSAHVIEQVLSKVGLSQSEINRFSRDADFREVKALFNYTNYYGETFYTDFINQWVRSLNVEKVGTYQVANLHELLEKFGSSESRKLFNVYVCKVVKTFGDLPKSMLAKFPVFIETPEEKKHFIEYALENAQGKSTVLQLGNFSHEDLKPYWDQLPAESKRSALGNDLGL